MLLEMAMADAYAIAWEFTDKQTASNDLSGYHQHPTYLELTPGQYTDDTQRSIANAEVILSANAVDKFDMFAYANSYVRAYKRDPREGYSRGYNAFLNSVETPESFLDNIRKVKDSNGALMGVAVLGYIKEIEHLKQAATIQAITTHHPSTAVYAQVVALAAHYYIHVATPDNSYGVRDFVLHNADFLFDEKIQFMGEVEDFSYNPAKRTTIKASNIAAWLIHCLGEHISLSAIVKEAVDRGGDTDSAAAVAVAVASLDPRIDNDLPTCLLDNLEPGGSYGVDFLKGLDARLVEKFL